MIEKFFSLKQRGTTFRTELRAGTVTFLSMAYIIAIQPIILAQAGMDSGAVMVGTCIASAIATLIMGLYANYPIGLAPGMGENFYFSYTLVKGKGIPWRTALGIVFLSGAAFFGVSLLKVREKIIDAIPRSLKNGIAVGIGFFIAMLGLKDAGFIVLREGALSLGNLHHPGTLLATVGLVIIAVLMARKVKGAIFIGMLITFFLGLPFGIVKFHGIVSKPPSLSPILFKMDIKAALSLSFIVPILAFFIMDMFDTIGTLIGIAEQAGFVDEKGRLPGMKKALLADSAGTLIGTTLGNSTVTSFIESATGVAEGGRTGLTAVFVSLYFLLSVFFYPFVKSLIGGYKWGGTVVHPITSPVLIIVGAMMFSNVRKMNLDDPTEYIPSLLTVLGMPLTMSISDGLGFGFISYALLKLLSGRAREVSLTLYILALVFVLKFAFL